MESIKEQIRVQVAAGFWNRNLVFEDIVASLGDELGLTDAKHDLDPATAAQLWEVLDAGFATHRQEMQSWPDVTDCDRLRAAFDTLDKQGIVALEHCGMTLQDGIQQVADMACVRDELGLVANDGYCFFHHQDTRNAIERGGLLLAFGTFREVPTTHDAEVGAAVARACRDAGLHAEWTGSPSHRIELPRFRWQRRTREIRESDVAEFLESWELEIRAGYTSTEAPDTLEARAERWFSEIPEFGPQLVSRLRAHTAHVVAAERARETTWSGPTINDRTSGAFAALRARGVHAAEYSGLTIQDGWGYVGANAAADRRGAVFFHREDVADGVAGRGLRLAYGALGAAPSDDERATLALGEEIVSVLAEHGVPCSWGESTHMRIQIAPFEWRRRRWTAAPMYPPSPRPSRKPSSLWSRMFRRGKPVRHDAGTATAIRELAIIVRTVIDEGGFDLRRTQQMQAGWNQLGRRECVHAGHLGTPHVFVRAGELTTMRPQLADENLRDERHALVARGRRSRLAPPS